MEDNRNITNDTNNSSMNNNDSFSVNQERIFKPLVLSKENNGLKIGIQATKTEEGLNELFSVNVESWPRQDKRSCLNDIDSLKKDDVLCVLSYCNKGFIISCVKSIEGSRGGDNNTVNIFIPKDVDLPGCELNSIINRVVEVMVAYADDYDKADLYKDQICSLTKGLYKKKNRVPGMESGSGVQRAYRKIEKGAVDEILSQLYQESYAGYTNIYLLFPECQIKINGSKVSELKDLSKDKIKRYGYLAEPKDAKGFNAFQDDKGTEPFDFSILRELDKEYTIFWIRENYKTIKKSEKLEKQYDDNIAQSISKDDLLKKITKDNFEFIDQFGKSIDWSDLSVIQVEGQKIKDCECVYVPDNIREYLVKVEGMHKDLRFSPFEETIKMDETGCFKVTLSYEKKIKWYKLPVSLSTKDKDKIESPFVLFDVKIDGDFDKPRTSPIAWYSIKNKQPETIGNKKESVDVRELAFDNKKFAVFMLGSFLLGSLVSFLLCLFLVNKSPNVQPKENEKTENVQSDSKKVDTKQNEGQDTLKSNLKETTDSDSIKEK